MNEKEFQTVVLAALLHDIGKFYARSREVQNLRQKAGYPGSHPIISTLLIEKDFASQLGNIGINTDLLKKLVQHHHENPGFPPECLVQSLSGSEKILALIVSRADNYSSMERYEDARQEKCSYEKVLLDSIFQRIGKDESALTNEYKIRPNEFSPENIFPEKIETGYWGDLIKKFGSEVKNLNANDFNSLFVALMHLIQKYCWSTPSDITRDVADISLSDHLKTTSAIAACLYKYHSETNSLNETEITNEQTKKFMLIGGDLSGIQRYIYDIAEVGVGGAAKRLRARSFKLSLLSEVVAHYILHQLGLPLSCLLFSVGGRFCVLSSADETSKEKFNLAKRFIEEWLLREFQGEIAVNLVSLSFSPLSFKSSDADSPEENFKKLWASFGSLIEKAKLRKFNDAFQEDGVWNNKFLSETEFENHPQGVCRVCHKFPAIVGEEDFKVCLHCDIDKELGEILLRANYLAFYKGRTSSKINFFDEYSVKLCEDSDEIEGSPYLVYSINNTKILPHFPSGFKFFANYVPTFKNEKDFIAHCNECSFRQKCEAREEIRNFPHVYTFQCIASGATGAKYLGVLKIDVDYLGFLINKIPQLSISRITTFASFLEAFFAGYLPKFFQENHPQSYVVYSGGDDLLLISSWDKAIILAKEIREKFDSFVCKNSDVHFSAGIALSRPKFPMANLAKFATELLDEAKDKGRNRLSVLSSNFEWDSFDNLRNFAKLLYDSLHEGEISSAFLYRLFTYQEMFNSYKNGRAEGLIYLSRLSYDIRRNLYDSQEKPKNELVSKLISELKKLFDYKGEGGMIMENLKFPVSYALLKERGE